MDHPKDSCEGVRRMIPSTWRWDIFKKKIKDLTFEKNEFMRRPLSFIMLLFIPETDKGETHMCQTSFQALESQIQVINNNHSQKVYFLLLQVQVNKNFKQIFLWLPSIPSTFLLYTAYR